MMTEEQIGRDLATSTDAARRSLSHLRALAEQMDAEADALDAEAAIHEGRDGRAPVVSINADGLEVQWPEGQACRVVTELAATSAHIEVIDEAAAALLLAAVATDGSVSLHVLTGDALTPIAKEVSSACFGPDGKSVIVATLGPDGVRANALHELSLDGAELAPVLLAEHDASWAVRRSSSGTMILAFRWKPIGGALLVSSGAGWREVWSSSDRELLDAEHWEAREAGGIVAIERHGDRRQVVHLGAQKGSSIDLLRDLDPIEGSPALLTTKRRLLLATLIEGVPTLSELSDRGEWSPVQIDSVLGVTASVEVWAEDRVDVRPASFIPRCGTRTGRLREERRFVRANDGVEIPITVLRCADRPMHGALLYVYGAFGASLVPQPSAARISLLDRGVAVVIAHVRGGGELGPNWHVSAVGPRKPRSWADLVDVAQALPAELGIAPGAVVAEGNSAGGLVAACAVRDAPGAFAGLLATVPFVDPLASLLDPDDPLAAVERGEWGDPSDPAQRSTIETYAPATAPIPDDHPSTLVTAAQHDARVRPETVLAWCRRLQDRDVAVHCIGSSGGHDEVSNGRDWLLGRGLQLAWTLERVRAVSRV